MTLSAPGKLILFGEYAVLEGAPAVVMAVNRRALIAPRPKGYEPATSLVSHAYAQARAHFGLAPEPCLYSVDSRAFYRGRLKLGLGSSAAATVLALAAAAREAGRDLSAHDTRHELWRLGHAAQNSYFGRQGSGLDLAASLFGGITLFESATPTPRFSPFAWPESLRLSFYWLGQPASTADFLGGLARFRQQRPDDYQAHLAALGEVAGRLCRAPLAAAPMLAALNAYAEALDRLGQAAALPILTAPMAALCLVARELGGAAKPSGAGGGDFLLAVFEDAPNEAVFAQKAAAAGLCRIPFAAEPQGLRLDEEIPQP